jgi:hypothetical protein
LLVVAAASTTGCLLDWTMPEPAASGGSAGTAAGGAAGSGGSVGGSGGTCGDGLIQAGEECDGGPTGAPGCKDCRVVCSCTSSACATLDVVAFVNPADHHCYLSRADKVQWTPSLAFCNENQMLLAAPTSLAEIQFITWHLQDNVARSWIGASDYAVEGEFEWLDPEEEWTSEHDALFISGQPGPYDYVSLDRAYQGFMVQLMGTPNSALCERRPPGKPAP